jgi:hypothetical protein
MNCSGTLNTFRRIRMKAVWVYLKVKRMRE